MWRVRFSVFVSFAVVLALLALGCMGASGFIAPREDVQKPSPAATEEPSLPYHDLNADQGRLNPLVIHPFPFRIEVFWKPLREDTPVTWEIKVINENDQPHRLAAIEIQGYMAALDFQPVSPSAEVETIERDDGIRKRLYYDLELRPGEEATLKIDVTTYFGMTTRGVLLFCAEIPALGNCMVLPMTAHVVK